LSPIFKVLAFFDSGASKSIDASLLKGISVKWQSTGSMIVVKKLSGFGADRHP